MSDLFDLPFEDEEPEPEPERAPTPVASTVMGAGRDSTGGRMSLTVTVKAPVPVFPAALVAVQTTVVVPMAKVEPDSGEHFLGKTLSEASAAARAVYPDRRTFVFRVGHDTTVHIGATIL